MIFGRFWLATIVKAIVENCSMTISFLGRQKPIGNRKDKRESQISLMRKIWVLAYLCNFVTTFWFSALM